MATRQIRADYGHGLAGQRGMRHAAQEDDVRRQPANGRGDVVEAVLGQGGGRGLARRGVLFEDLADLAANI